MEQSVVFGNGAVVRFGSHMFQKSGETADDLLPIQFFCRAAVFFRSQPFPCGTEGPGIFHHSSGLSCSLTERSTFHSSSERETVFVSCMGAGSGVFLRA